MFCPPYSFSFSVWPFATWLLTGSLLVGSLLAPAVVAHGDETATKTRQKFSPEVVEKAERILAEHGLRRSGKSLQAKEASDVNRAVTSLSREKRELKLIRKDWVEAQQRVMMNRQLSRNLLIMDGDLNLRLAKAVSVTDNNKIVGMINANRAKQKLVKQQLEILRTAADAKRSALNDAETKYAEAVLAIRASLETLKLKVAKALGEKDVITAIKVVQTNFDVAADQTQATVLASVERRVARVEEDIFSESIPMRIEGGALIVDVVVDRKSVPMVVDSGATLVSLPVQTATKLGITVPDDAPKLNLIMADGREISARQVTLARVRVGNFEAEGVDAAVLDATATNAEPLLGMSFLGNFKFEIDTSAKSLKMLRIEDE